MKIMISQPMNGKTKAEIIETRERAVEKCQDMGYEIVDTFFYEEWELNGELEEKGVKQNPVYFLGKAIEKMSLCDKVYFCKGWASARGCQIENTIARCYHLECIYEEDEAYEEFHKPVYSAPKSSQII
jgi:hypothetical protein